MVTTTKYVWDPVFDCVTHELDENNFVKAVYNNEPQQYGGVLSQRRGTTSHYHHHDALGSTRFLTDNSSNVTDTYLHDAWGNPVASSGTTVNPFKWVGKYGYYTDNSTGQLYVRARMYQRTLARWKSMDPLQFIASDLYLRILSGRSYTYAFLNPPRFPDSSGQFPRDWFRPKAFYCDSWQCMMLAALLHVDDIYLYGEPLIKIANELKETMMNRKKDTLPSCPEDDLRRSVNKPFAFDATSEERDFRLNNVLLPNALAALLGLANGSSLDLILGRVHSVKCEGKESQKTDCCDCVFEYKYSMTCHVQDWFNFNPEKNSHIYNGIALEFQRRLKAMGITLGNPLTHAYVKVEDSYSSKPNGCDQPKRGPVVRPKMEF